MSKSKDFATPVAIVVAGAIIAAALYFALSNKAQAPSALGQEDTRAQEINIRSIQKDDLVKGNRNAELVIYEYSDTECPFCKRFHETMNKLTEKYSDKIAWVYRHFPLDQLHPKARTEARAVECAVRLSGPNKGFDYLNRMMEITPSNNGLDLKELPKIAAYVGLDANAFQTCMDKKETDKDVKVDFEEAVKNGAQGTPHNIIIYKDQKIAVPGALPYEQMEKLVNDLLGS